MEGGFLSDKFPTGDLQALNGGWPFISRHLGVIPEEISTRLPANEPLSRYPDRLYPGGQGAGSLYMGINSLVAVKVCLTEF